MNNIREIRDNEKLLYILSDNNVNKTSSKVLSETTIILYLYYEETVWRYLKYVSSLPKEVSVYIVTSNKTVYGILQRFLHENTSDICYPEINLLIQPNQGRDVAALVVTCREIILRAKYFCFVHDKIAKSDELEEDTDKWITNIWENTLASRQYIENVINIFESRNDIGVLVPPEPIGNHMSAWFNRCWYGSYEDVKQLQNRLQLRADIKEEFAPITLSTVLWGRSKALEKVFRYEWSYDDFAKENEPVSAISYAIERIWGYAAQEAGYKTGTIMTSQYAGEQMIFLQSLLENAYLILNKFFRLGDASEINAFPQKLNQIQDYYKTKKHVYLYGAGQRAERNINILKSMQLSTCGIVVTNKQSNPKEHCGLPVYGIDEITLDNLTGIIIAVGEENRLSVEEELHKRGVKDYVTFI